jgi:integrase
MPKVLTTKSVENLKSGTDRQEIPDGGCRGLYLVAQPSGARSWAIRFRLDGKPAKHTIGSYPTVSLAEARRLAAAALAQVAQGTDPRTEKREAKAAATERGRDTVDRLSAQFIDWQGKRLRPNSIRQLNHVFADLVLPEWQGRDVHDIARIRRDARELLEAIAETNGPVMAIRAHLWLHRFFGWLQERDVIIANPMAGLPRPAAESARERTLSERELVALWHACEAVPEPWRSWIRMLILLGQRRSETAGMRRSEIDGDLWHLPAERMKGRVAHTLPLPAQAVAIIEAMPPIGDGDLIFTPNGTSPLSHFDRIKRAIDVEMKPAAPWCWHDIRRTTASGMAGLGIPIPVIEKILAHRSGTFRGIVGTYQRHSFLPEMHSALQRWSEHLDRLVRGAPASKVVPIGRR